MIPAERKGAGETAPVGSIEIGFGGDSTGLKGGTLRERLEHLKRLLAEYDSEARIEFLESRPSADRVEEESEVAAEMGLPFRQFTDVYVLGGDSQRPDALVTLKSNLDIAARSGTIERLNMQVWGDSQSPSTSALLHFYLEAYELADKFGIQLFTETHIDRITYDPRRLTEIHQAIQVRTAGARGLSVCADFSHYVHQIGNTHMANWADIQNGALNLNPEDPSNYVTRHIIEPGLVGYAHLRMAVPNNLGRKDGPIQYPLVDPAHDRLVAPPLATPLKSGPFDESRQRPWKEWYRQVFAGQLRHPERPVLRASSEFIDGLQYGLYRVDEYSNLFQNIAMVSWAQRFVTQIRSELQKAVRAGWDASGPALTHQASGAQQ